MSVSGIGSSALSQQLTGPLMQPTKRQSEDQIGRTLELDLQHGDLPAAQQAYNNLAAFGPHKCRPFTTPTMKCEFQTLGEDLQAGNLTAAQSDNRALATNLLKQDVQDVVQGGGSQSAATAMANLKGDFWAIYGQAASGSDLSSLLGVSSSAISVQA